MLIDCPRRGSDALALIVSFANAFLISIECSMRPLSSLFVSWAMHIKFFPVSDVADVDIIRAELRHNGNENLRIVIKYFFIRSKCKQRTDFSQATTNLADQH